VKNLIHCYPLSLALFLTGITWKEYIVTLDYLFAYPNMSDFEVAEELSFNKLVLPNRVGQIKDLAVIATLVPTLA